MTSVLGELLPLAVGVAISPIPIIAGILMLLSKNAGKASIGFGTGWVTGILAVTVIASLLADALGGRHHGQPSATVSWIKIGLGAVLIVLALRQWQHRTDTEQPAWMRAIDGLTTVKAVGLGAALAAANPKNLMLCLAAGAAIGAGGLSGGGSTITVIVFTLLAASTVLGPVLAYAIAGDRMRGLLDDTKSWLQTYNAQVMTVVLLIMGATVLGKGLAGL
ncbi:GAP family protein [Nocardia sp. NPDC005825]|uniref:GAP family protein n=1 Tax=unclassified Nocardia TaxID=2637762 RepID=UPI0033EDAA9E